MLMSAYYLKRKILPSIGKACGSGMFSEDLRQPRGYDLIGAMDRVDQDNYKIR